MSNKFQAPDRGTVYLLPPSIDDWLPERHLARLIVDVVEELDLQPLESEYAGCGSKPYHPGMLLGLLFYGYATGTFSRLLGVSCTILISSYDIAESDSTLGSVVWSYPVGDPYARKVAPAIDGDRVFAVADGRVRCFELETGELCWESESLKGERDLGNGALYQDRDRLYLDDGSRVVALAKKDGAVVWDVDIPGITVAYTRLPVTLSRDFVFIGGKGEVVRLKKTTGEVDLRIRLDQLHPEGETLYAVGPRVSTDGLLYVPAQYLSDSLRAYEGRLLVYDALSGAFRWGVEVPRRKRLPRPDLDSTHVDRGGESIVLSDELAILEASTSLFAFKRHSGEMLWEWYANDGLGNGIDAGGGMAFAGSPNGRMYAVDLETGDLVWKVQTPGFIHSVVYHDGRVYSCNTGSGMIYVVDAQTGDVLFRDFPPGYDADNFDTCLSPLSVGGEYMVNVGPRHIYAWRAK